MNPSDDGRPDELLASLAHHGDTAAFDILVRRHKGSLYQFVRRYVGQADDAYDVLQEAFIAAWKGLRRYDSRRPFLPWLRVVTLNKCRDFGRRQRVRRLLLRTLSLDAEFHRRSGPLGIDARDDETERFRHLDDAIAGLPEIYKDPLLLTAVAGLSQREAAETLKISVKALEMRLYRARQRLTDAIQAG